jgi:hypothetical protein
METSLHRELKRIYAGEAARTEVRLGRYRIDAMVGEELVEIQHGPLTAIRDKIARLLETHTVRVVKPIVGSKLLVKRRRKNGRSLERRLSPRKGCVLDIFDELVHFTRVFPHPRLTLEVPLVDIEEWRYPGHGRRRWRRRGDFVVEDRKLTAIAGAERLQTAADLVALLGCDLPCEFNSGLLADALGIHRSTAQLIAYVLRKTGAVSVLGRRRSGWIYGRAA